LDITAVWNQSIVHPLMVALKWLADLTHSGGLAIILMTLIIKTILLPLSLKQTNSMKAMTAIQPEIAALKKKVKDREKLTQDTMRIYKERGINPAAGCLPMLPMMLVLIGLYGALINLAQCDAGRDLAIACDPRFAEPFLWVPRLDHPDILDLALGFPLPGILPIAMAVTQFFSSKMMTMPTQDPQQQSMNRMMTIMMPGMMLFWGVTFPAGLVLYWFVSNVYEMVRLYFTMGPQSLGSIGSFKFGSTASAVKEAESTDGDAGPVDRTQSETPDGGPRANGRPTRPRQKRGKRSGRR
jgi:YidC/Oxa1 family membrane protein insertase